MTIDDSFKLAHKCTRLLNRKHLWKTSMFTLTILLSLLGISEPGMATRLPNSLSTANLGPQISENPNDCLSSKCEHQKTISVTVKTPSPNSVPVSISKPHPAVHVKVATKTKTFVCKQGRKLQLIKNLTCSQLINQYYKGQSALYLKYNPTYPPCLSMVLKGVYICIP